MSVPAPDSRYERILDTNLFAVHGVPVTIGSLAVATVTIGVSVLLARLFRSGLERALEKKGAVDHGTAIVVGRLLQYLAIAVGIAIALQTIGIDVGTLFAAGAFFAVAIGFAMQSIMQNFVSGVILLAERSIKPGDVLDVDGRVVRITRLGLRATVARTRDDEDLIIPNSVLAQQIVTNYTLRDSVYRVRATVDVAYESDMEQVTASLRTAAAGIEGREAGRDPRILMTGFGASGVNFEVSVWMQDPWDARITQSTLNEAIWWEFKKQGITIPFTQMDLHVIRPPAHDTPTVVPPAKNPG